MQRTIEKLAADRRALEDRFREAVAELRRLGDSLEGIHSRLESSPCPSGPFRRRSGGDRLRQTLLESVAALQAVTASVARMAEAQDALGDLRDKEWDALGNNHVGMVIKSLEWRIDRLATEAGDAAAVIRTFLQMRDQVGRLLADLEARRLPSADRVKEILKPLEDWDYLRFENRFRGAPAEIRRRQAGYLSLLPSGGRVLDLGCGRGEFLELLSEAGFKAQGVDGNAGMVSLCRDKGLDVVHGDALQALAARPDASLEGLFSSQVIEHLSAPEIRGLVGSAWAKLAPGGVLLLETVNPTSVFALVRIYLLDFTHRTPVHPLALQFLMEAAGFTSVEIRYAGDLAGDRLESLPCADDASVAVNRNFDRLNALLFGPPEYAAIGRKP